MAFIGFIAFFAFLFFGGKSVFNALKKNGKAKKSLIWMGASFLVFVIGFAASPSEDTASKEKEETKQEESDEKEEEKESDSQEKDEAKEDQKENKEEKKEEKSEPKEEPKPSTVADVHNAIKKDMSFDDYLTAKEELNAENPKSISIGNGNIGSVIKAKDGIVVVNTDGEKVLSLVDFKNMSEVDQYEQKRLAEAEKQAKEEAKKEREQTKITLSGNGDTATDGFKLKSGFAVFEGVHNGAANFIVELQDENGNPVELMVNTIGSYKGKTLAMIPAGGTYYLNVDAAGNWSFDIYQTPPVDVAKAPTEIKGNGDDVVFFQTKSGNHKFTFNHSGSSNFIVALNGSNLLVNEIGNYQGSTRHNLSTDGLYLLQIESEGSWNVVIEK